MITIAFSLGILGSLHCIGMCGPIALGLSPGDHKSKWQVAWQSLQYNLGRVITYILLGMIFGLIGESLVIAGIQKSVSIVAGIIFIVLFFFSMDLEQFLHKIPWLKSAIEKYKVKLIGAFSPALYKRPLTLGIFNGFIPCGLVYLALAGSLLEQSLFGSMLFMLVFGLATIPALFVLLMTKSMVKMQWRMRMRKVLPYVQLVMGIIFLYRGFAVDLPLDIDFYLGLREGPSCH